MGSNSINFKNIKYNRLSIIRLLLLMFALIATIILSYNLFDLEANVSLNLIDSENVKVEVFSNYQDSGFEVKINGKTITMDEVEYTVQDNIDYNVLGNYVLLYNINYKNRNYSLKRNVEIVDEQPPEIVLFTDQIEKYSCRNEDKINFEYKVIDNYDGVITDKATITKNSDEWIIEATDSSNNNILKKIPIVMVDDVIPVITLNGLDTIYVKKNGEYKEQGATVANGCGKEIDEEVSIDGFVDTSIVGEYIITYEVLLTNGRKANKTRKVIVYENHYSIVSDDSLNKVIYLTFDDGPGQYTNELLDILKKYNIKATFFVTNQFKTYAPLITREYNDGHTVAIHTLTHKWNLYSSVETYIKDFNDMNDIIYKYTGHRTNIFRFPGGSSNTISKRFATGVVGAISSKMTELGYIYFDWNVDSGDAAGASKKQIYNNVINGIKNRKYSVVLMHDIKKNTISVIEDIINYALANGYTFEVINEKTPTTHHHINN